METTYPHPHPTGLMDYGVVYKKTTGSYTVRTGGRAIDCTLSSKLRKMPGDLIAVGDQVHFVETPDGRGLINEVLPRRNSLSRQAAVPMPGGYTHEQVIVANVDQVIPVFAAAMPAPRWNLLDRYLVTAESMDLPALICITKLDLIQHENGLIDQETAEVVDAYRTIGYPVVLVSALTGEGMDELSQALHGHISVFVGKSGVGKSSLLNALQPGLGLRVNEISKANGKGKHTTTHQEMFSLDGDSAIIDTPGIREFGLWDIDAADLALFFPEMRPFIGRCKFGAGCGHDEEPGCAIRKAVMSGEINPRRYQSYMRMKESD